MPSARRRFARCAAARRRAGHGLEAPASRARVRVPRWVPLGLSSRPADPGVPPPNLGLTALLPPRGQAAWPGRPRRCPPAQRAHSRGRTARSWAWPTMRAAPASPPLRAGVRCARRGPPSRAQIASHERWAWARRPPGRRWAASGRPSARAAAWCPRARTRAVPAGSTPPRRRTRAAGCPPPVPPPAPGKERTSAGSRPATSCWCAWQPRAGWARRPPGRRWAASGRPASRACRARLSRRHWPEARATRAPTRKSRSLRCGAPTASAP